AGEIIGLRPIRRQRQRAVLERWLEAPVTHRDDRLAAHYLVRAVALGSSIFPSTRTQKCTTKTPV
ncbi:hypothetical protein, partial [Lysobacter claricitrinus]|uniref:hypothetical protein n=1 Tax=Lysobacter claricitrinus TaxID=3367728 RepID=UPI0038B3F2B2